MLKLKIKDKPMRDKNLSLLTKATIGLKNGITVKYASTRDTSVEYRIASAFNFKLVSRCWYKPAFQNLDRATNVSLGLGKNTLGLKIQNKTNAAI